MYICVLNNKEINHFINKYLNNTTYKAQIKVGSEAIADENKSNQTSPNHCVKNQDWYIREDGKNKEKV